MKYIGKRNFKARVSAKSGMPTLCQKLCLGTDVLRDGQKLIALCRGVGADATRTLNVTLGNCF